MNESVRTEPSDIEADVAYLRDLAHQAVAAPLIHGSTLIWWGTILALAYGLQGLWLNGEIAASLFYMNHFWVGVSVLAWTGQFFLNRRFKSGAGSIGNMVSSQAWLALGIAATMISFSTAVAVALGWADPRAFLFLPTANLALYGVVFWIVASAGRQAVYARFAILSIAIACVLIGLTSSSLFYFFAAAAKIICAIVPGALMLANETDKPREGK